MPQTTLFYPLGDTAAPAKISAGALIVALPLIGLGVAVFIALGAVYIIAKVTNIICGDRFVSTEEQAQPINQQQ